jgi:hypothetical protein
MVAARVAVIRLRVSWHSFDLLYKFLGISLIRIIFLHHRPAILVLNHGDKGMFEGFVKISNRWVRAVEILRVSTLYDELQVYHRGGASVVRAVCVGMYKCLYTEGQRCGQGGEKI